MNVVVQVLNFISQEILNVPAYLIGIIAAIGLIALKRSAGQVVSGALKAAMGYLILGAGATVVTSALAPFGDLVLKSTGAHGVVPTNEVITAQASSQYGASSAYIIVLSFIVMLLLARFTPLKYIFLTGHHMVFMSTMLAVVLSVGFGTDHQLLIVIIGAILMGVIMVVMPAFAQPFMNRVTGSDKLSIGHFNTLGYIVSGAVGAGVGKKSKSTEDINFPKGLSFLRDSMVSTTLLMVVLYLVFLLMGVSLGGVDMCVYTMILECCSSNSVGRYSGYYYTVSMAAQVITPILSGVVMDVNPAMLFAYITGMGVLMGLSVAGAKHGDAILIDEVVRREEAAEAE